MINKNEVVSLFGLSKISYNENELRRIVDEMGGIIELIDKIKQIESTVLKKNENKVEYTHLQKDVVIDSASTCNTLKNTKFTVPRVV